MAIVSQSCKHFLLAMSAICFNICPNVITLSNDTIKQHNPPPPVLFLLFVNDLPLYLHNSSAAIFADEATLSLKAHFDDIVNLTNTLNTHLVNLSEWFKENRMFMNV